MSSKMGSPAGCPGVLQYRGRMSCGKRRKDFHTGFFSGADAWVFNDTGFRGVTAWVLTNIAWSSGSRYPGESGSFSWTLVPGVSAADADTRGAGVWEGSDFERHKGIAFVTCAGDDDADDGGVVIIGAHQKSLRYF